MKLHGKKNTECSKDVKRDKQMSNSIKEKRNYKSIIGRRKTRIIGYKKLPAETLRKTVVNEI